MLLTPTEMERLTIYVAAELARKHKSKGLQLNHPEAVAFIVDEILEGAREGRSVADLIAWGSTLLSTDDVMPGVAELMPMIQVEGTFPDGTKLVTIHDPDPAGQTQVPVQGDDRPRRNPRRRRRHRNQRRPADGQAQGAQHRRPAGAGGQPLSFLRDQQGARVRPGASFGMHLDIPAGTAVRFAPGESKDVVLTEFGGSGELLGLNGLTDGNWRSHGEKGRGPGAGPATRLQGSMTPWHG